MSFLFLLSTMACGRCRELQVLVHGRTVSLQCLYKLFNHAAKHQQRDGRRATGALHQQFLAATLLGCRVGVVAVDAVLSCWFVIVAVDAVSCGRVVDDGWVQSVRSVDNDGCVPNCCRCTAPHLKQIGGVVADSVFDLLFKIL
jgi:hypothetical protein